MMDDIKAQYETNVFGLIRTTQGVLPTMMHLNDVAVEKDSKLLYYQIKSTTNSSLSRADIIDSFKLFSSIESRNGKSRYNEYILVSNAKIRNFNDNDMVKHPFIELDNQIKEEIKHLEGIRTPISFLQRTYLLKGPTLQEISSIMIHRIFKALKERITHMTLLKE